MIYSKTAWNHKIQFGPFGLSWDNRFCLDMVVALYNPTQHSIMWFVCNNLNTQQILGMNLDSLVYCQDTYHIHEVTLHLLATSLKFLEIIQIQDFAKIN